MVVHSCCRPLLVGWILSAASADLGDERHWSNQLAGSALPVGLFYFLN